MPVLSHSTLNHNVFMTVSDLPEATVRGITLRGLRKLVEKIKEKLKAGQFLTEMGKVIRLYSELTTADIVET